MEVGVQESTGGDSLTFHIFQKDVVAKIGEAAVTEEVALIGGKAKEKWQVTIAEPDLIGERA